MSNLVGTILVGVFSVVASLSATWWANKASERRLRIQHDLDRKKDSDSARLKKSEEIYLSLIKYRNNINNSQRTMIGIFQGDINIDTISVEKVSEAISFDYDALEASVGIYFRNLLPELKNIKVYLDSSMSGMGQFGEIAPHEMSQLEKDNVCQYVYEFMEVIKERLSSLIEDLSKEVN